MGKRPLVSTSSQYVTREDVARLEKMMDRMEFLLEEIYRFTKSKATGVHLEDVEISSPEGS